MKDSIRPIALTVILIHHMITWCFMSQITDDGLTDDIKKKIRIFQTYGPRFLTNWTFFNQTIYIIVALFCCRQPTETANKLRRVNWCHFWSVVFPWTLVVPLVFWVFYNYDRELIFPSFIDYLIPRWVNHAIHTNILALVALELFLSYDRPPRLTPVFITLSGYGLLYMCVLFQTYFESNVWLYSFLGLLNWPQRFVMVLGTWALLWGFTRTGIWIQDLKYRSALARSGKQAGKIA